jgi:hypothetical protein
LVPTKVVKYCENRTKEQQKKRKIEQKNKGLKVAVGGCGLQ